MTKYVFVYETIQLLSLRLYESRMNTRDLEAFLAVVETGSIVGASARLHLTQPGVSRRIQSLEEQLGVALLDRQSKPLKPTAAGRETYAQGRRMLRVLEISRRDCRPRESSAESSGSAFRLICRRSG